jgi:hypothetical protein
MRLFYLMPAILSLSFIAPAEADLGAVLFATSPTSGVTARIFLPSMVEGPGKLGAGVVKAELYLISLNGSTQNLILSTNTTFRAKPLAATFYIEPVAVTIPGSNPGDTAELKVRVWPASFGSFDAARTNLTPNRIRLLFLSVPLVAQPF